MTDWNAFALRNGPGGYPATPDERAFEDRKRERRIAAMRKTPEDRK